MKNKTIVISGASSGLGRQLYEDLRKDNSLILVDISENKGFSESERCVYIKADVTNGKILEENLNSALAKFDNAVDGIVNLTAVPDYKTLSQTDYDDIRNIIDVKIVGYANVIKACMDKLRNGSSIVNVSSTAAYSTVADSGALYAAANAGVIGLTRALSVSTELRRRCRVNVVCPGGFLTDEYKTHFKDWEQKLQKGQILQAKDVSNVILFLLGNESKGVNGAEVKVEVGVGNLRTSSSTW